MPSENRALQPCGWRRAPCLGLLLPALPARPRQLSPPQLGPQQPQSTVELETLASLDSLRIAQDLGGLFNDGTTRRLVTVLGTTAIQNYWDLRVHARG